MAGRTTTASSVVTSPPASRARERGKAAALLWLSRFLPAPPGLCASFPLRCSCERTQAASDADVMARDGGTREERVVVLVLVRMRARLCVCVCKLGVHLRQVCSCRPGAIGCGSTTLDGGELASDGRICPLYVTV